MSVELKIKAKSLGAEAHFIRKEEKKKKAEASWNDMKQAFGRARGARETLDSLYYHRTQVVRREARATHLARAFLAGKPAHMVEWGSYTSPDFRAITRMVKKYASNSDLEDIINWYEE